MNPYMGICAAAGAEASVDAGAGATHARCPGHQGGLVGCYVRAGRAATGAGPGGRYSGSPPGWASTRARSLHRSRTGRCTGHSAL